MRIGKTHQMLAFVACTGMISPTAAMAHQPPQQPQPVFADVALQQGGLLTGSVVDQQGVAQPGTDVSIRYRDDVVARTTTDENGVFAVQGLRGGQYELATEQGASAVRAWSPETAPPAARPLARIVQGEQVVRGAFMGMSTGTLIGVGVAVTAIGVGIGVAIANDDDGPRS